eukprot:20784-Heterococcus_DN1.PRE.3
MVIACCFITSTSCSVQQRIPHAVVHHTATVIGHNNAAAISCLRETASRSEVAQCSYALNDWKLNALVHAYNSCVCAAQLLPTLMGMCHVGAAI